MRRSVLFAVTAVAAGCGDPCLDDGFSSKDCSALSQSASNSASDTSAGTESTTTMSVTVSISGTTLDTMSMSGMSMTSDDTETQSTTTPVTATESDGETATESDSETVTVTETETTAGTTAGTTTYCDDEDGDTFGDPDDCVDVPAGENPPAGFVPDDNDCDDGDADTFPGAAPNDDLLACMNDDDGDDWGDDDPAGGVDAGTDCDDSDVNAFPGAAELESDTLCMKDSDEDGWGDDTPPGGVTPGSDCDEDGAPPCALLVTQDGTANDTYDQALIAVLTGLGFATITNVADDASIDTDANGRTIVVISETAFSLDVGAKFRDVVVPVVCLEGFIWDDMGISPSPGTTTTGTADILMPVHPLAGGLTGSVDIVSGGGSGLFFVVPPVGAIEIASVTGLAADVCEFAFDAGDPMEGGFTAPHRRVALGYDADQAGGGATILSDGQVLFEAAVVWATM